MWTKKWFFELMHKYDCGELTTEQVWEYVDLHSSASNGAKPIISGGWSIGKKVEVTGCFYGHDFEIGEIVEIIEHEPRDTTSWLCTNGKDNWWLSESEGNCS